MRNPTPLTILVRDLNLAAQGQLLAFTRADLVLRRNDVSTWAIDVNADDPMIGALVQPFAGITVMRAGAVLTSGLVLKVARTVDENGDRFTFSGADDTLYMKRRLAMPQPATAAPPYNANAYDTQTGRAETCLRGFVDRNLGPSALAARRNSYVVLQADQARGLNGTWQGRYQTLLDLCQQIALEGGDLGFVLLQSGQTLALTISVPRDLSATVQFALEAGNATSIEYALGAPDADYVICGGGGEGTARTIVEGGDSAAMARYGRVEMFRDRRDTTDTTVMTSTINAELADHAATATFKLVATDQQFSYGVDYGLGDRVSVSVGGTAFTQVVRECHVVADADHIVSMEPTLATPGTINLSTITDALLRQRGRLEDLERR